MVKSSIPYFDVNSQHKAIREELLVAIERTLDSGNYILGPEVSKFEEDFAKYLGIKHCIGTNSGTTALHLALIALDIQPGDEVITTPFTFAATAWAISYVGATPVFVDIDPETFNIDPKCVLKAITKKTKAIIPVHLYGQSCDMGALSAISEEFNIPLLEDAAQAHGATYKGQQVGTLSPIAAFSFYPTKNLGCCGEGGAVVTNDDQLAEKVRLYRNHASKERYKYEDVGYNYRMEGMQGAILQVKLKYLDQWNEERRSIANLYTEKLSSVMLPKEADYGTHAWHLYTIRVEDRKRFIKHLEDHQIGYSTHYAVPMHIQKAYKHLDYTASDLPESIKAAEEVVNLPLYPGMKKEDAEYVVEIINNF